MNDNERVTTGFEIDKDDNSHLIDWARKVQISKSALLRIIIKKALESPEAITIEVPGGVK